MGWSPGAVKAAHEMWTKDGLSASQISVELGNAGHGYYSRNAVIGRLTRDGLSGKGLRRPRQNRSLPRIRSKRASRLLPAAPKPSRAMKAVEAALTSVENPVQMVEKIDTAPDALQPLCSLTDLTTATCRWPSGDPRSELFGYCGRPVVERLEEGRMPFPYCAEHLFRAYDRSRQLTNRQPESAKPSAICSEGAKICTD